LLALTDYLDQALSLLYLQAMKSSKLLALAMFP
jgi:hypothetical protein